MAKYIEKQALLNEMHSLHSTPLIMGHITDEDIMFKTMVSLVEEQPTADVVEVKQGYWQDKFNRNRMVSQSFCSVCGKHSGIGGIESNRHKP